MAGQGRGQRVAKGKAYVAIKINAEGMDATEERKKMTGAKIVGTRVFPLPSSSPCHCESSAAKESLVHRMQ